MSHRLEAPVVAEVLLALGTRPDCRVWRHNTGKLEDRTGRWVSFGLEGSGDVQGVLSIKVGRVVIGVSLWVECKSATGRLRERQRNFRRMIESLGGIYIVARSGNDAVSGVEGFLYGLNG